MGLQHAVTLEVHISLDHMRVLGGLTRAEYRGKAHIATFEQLAPLRTSASDEDVLERRTHFAPTAHVPLLGEAWIVLQFQLLQQQRVELRLQRAQGNVVAIGATVSGVEM
ncbi:hypothetical protein D9M68_806880 [compost metagenome]